jgi:hypothetical protein
MEIYPCMHAVTVIQYLLFPSLFYLITEEYYGKGQALRDDIDTTIFIYMTGVSGKI